MDFVSWIIAGLVIGWSAGKILKGYAYVQLMNIAMGICAAVAGGLLLQPTGLGGYRGTILTTLVAMISAVLLMLLAGVVNGRRLYARQL
jgi:uncharacterized membrane protein YeaQ/YmgE (transglycosylase-associated protein family)